MRKSFYKCALVCSTALAFVAPQLVHAQGAPVTGTEDPGADNPDAQEDPGDIIVTGSQIRGIKPVGSAVVQQSREDIKNSGKNDLNQVLAELPQAQFFQGLVQPSSSPLGGNAAGGNRGAQQSPVNRPNLRNIPGANDSAGQPTLVLMDGHRLVPTGTFQAAIDVGVVPSGVLERNEIMLDGASAIYGSDAVGGVINLITRKRYDGIEVNARYGFAADYWQRNFSVTAGKNWGSGGFVINYEYSQNSNILVRDRDYLKPLNYLETNVIGSAASGYTAPRLTGASCDSPNVRQNGVNPPAGGQASQLPTWHLENGALVSGSAYCWQGDTATFFPKQKLHSLFLSGEQEIADGVKLDMTALFSRRQTEANFGAIATSANIAAGDARRPAGGPAGTQTVFYSLGPILGYDTQRNGTQIELFNVTPQLTVDIGRWQVRGLFNFGQSKIVVDQNELDNSVLSGLVTSGALNPYNVSSISATALAQLQGGIRQVLTTGKQQFTQVRLVGDGPLFTLPGGEVRAAIGAEWMQHKAEQQLTEAGTYRLLPFASATTSSKSVFGELVVPLFSSENAAPLLAGLTLSASGRFDDYGQYGSTFNPRLAATWNPVEWITVRGSWSKSLRAPNAMDKLTGDSSRIVCLTNAVNVLSGCTSSLPDPTFLDPLYSGLGAKTTPVKYGGLNLSGTDRNVRPETSTNWAIGVDIDPPFIPGLRLSATYWSIDYKDQIARSGSSPNEIFQNIYGTGSSNLSEICVTPTGASTGKCDAAIAAYRASGIGGQTAYDTLINAGYQIYYLLDTRFTNLASTRLAGIDASASYQRPTGFGSIDLRVSGSIPTKRITKATSTAIERDALLYGGADVTSDFRLTASAGATIGQFRAQATWRFSSSYIAGDWACQIDPTVPPCSTTVPPTRRPDQFRIGQFDTVDLLLRYSFKSDDWLTRDLDLTLNINNLFNSHPPYSFTATGGVVGGQTLGRLVQFGLSKKI